MPGSDGPIEDEDEALEEAAQIGFPVMIKASRRRWRERDAVARDEDGCSCTFAMARNEAKAAFDDPSCTREVIVPAAPRGDPVLGDRHGNIVHLGERDCSVQRRHQKLSRRPEPGASRRSCGEDGRRCGAGRTAIDYTAPAPWSSCSIRTASFYFMEMNTRIQVEHPVTELVTGSDLIKEQIRVAAGEKLELRNARAISRHAIECRINAEDPEHGFRPSPGRSRPSMRPVDRASESIPTSTTGTSVPPYYDSLLAKLIVHGKTRTRRACRAYHALEEFIVEGIHTTIPFLQTVLSHPDFEEGNIDTHFIERL